MNRAALHRAARADGSVSPYKTTAIPITFPPISPLSPSHRSSPLAHSLNSILSPVTPQYFQPSSQRQSVPDPLLSSHIHPPPTLAFPLPKSLILGPSGAVHMMHPHDQYTPPFMLGHQPWYPAVPPPTLQMFHPDVVPNMKPREASATYEHLPPIPPSYGAPANAYQITMTRPPTHSNVTTHLPTRVSFRKKTRPAADYTPNLGLVQAHCIADGGDPAAINLLRVTFAGGISIKALTRFMTRDEAREYNHGASGQVYRLFLRVDEKKRLHCRLCAVGTDEEGWKHAKDTLRHLKRDHFGLGTCCDRCGKIAYTKGELTRHRCVASANPAAVI